MFLTQEELLQTTSFAMKTQGRVYQKNKNVFARKAQAGEQIVTTTGDGKETQNTAQEGDYIIINQTAAQEEYIVPSEKFKQKYDLLKPVNQEVKEYKAKGKITALELTEELLVQLRLPTIFYFIAPWGKQMVGKKGDFLAQPFTNKEVYRIARKEFFETYEAISD